MSSSAFDVSIFDIDKTLLPSFPGNLRKNDALFLFGAISKRKPFVYSYEQEVCEIIHGPSCKIAEEVCVDKCCNNGVHIYERRGGGGTVVLSKGMCVTIVVGNRENRSALPIFNEIHYAIISLLEKKSVSNLVLKGISDIAINGQKVLGSSLYLGTRPPLYYYQSSLMVSSDLTLIQRYLKHPPREPDYRENRDHLAFCTTLQQAGYSLSAESICNVFNEQLPGLIK